MQYLSIIIFIILPIFLFGQNRKIEICEKNGEIHPQQVKINGKLRNYKLLNVTADSVFLITRRSKLKTYALNEVQNPISYVDNLTTYITVCTNNGNKFVGKLDKETPELIVMNLGFDNTIIIQKSNISKEYRQYLPFQKRIKLDIQTTQNQYINGRFIKTDSSYLYLKSKRKTLLIPHDNIQSEYRFYHVNPPTYSFGLSTVFAEETLILFEVKVNLLTMRRYALGIRSKLILNDGYFIPSLYGDILLSPRSSFSVDIGVFMQPEYNKYNRFLLLPEFSYRYFLGKKHRFYVEASTGALDTYNVSSYYFKVGGGLQF